ncbi:MAG: hypothetical protein HYY96_11865 [Candidatus Tectomicrobia bacterium]|nr:hypothetical protein [Candidatus Tectomicrobia bacterium]
MNLVYVNCPRCEETFYVDPEFFEVPDAYCHCPYCAHEFSVYRQRSA